jgi:hypothetical protein
MKPQIIIESLDLSEAIIDAEKRTVRQRLFAAGESKNGRVYGEGVLQDAAPLFEGRQTFANHPSKADLRDRPERSVLDLTGWLESVEYKDGALWATRHFARNTAGDNVWSLVQSIVEGSAPATLLGASINAIGRGRKENGKLLVEAITAVNSVDDVTTPAAGGGFFAEADTASITDELLAAMTFDEWYEARPEFVQRLSNEMKTARQDAALTEATALAERTLAELEAAQGQIDVLETANVAARDELTRVRRELAIVEALQRVQLPAQWKTDLRQRLLVSEPAQWDSIISNEVSKAKSAGAGRVNVTGAGQQVSEAVATPKRNSPLPLPGEDAEAWAQRMRMESK